MTGAVAEQPARPSFVRMSVAGIALLAGLAVLIAYEPSWNLRLRTAWFDTCQTYWPRDVVSTPATVVEIDDRSLTRLGQWPWPRSVLAGLVSAIERAQPAAIGIDILMSEPDRLSPESDSELARAIAAGPVVLVLVGTDERTGKEPHAPPFVIADRAKSGLQPAEVAKKIPAYPGALTNIDELDRAAAGHGVISTELSDNAPRPKDRARATELSDNVLRRFPLVARIGGRLAPSLPMEMLRVALGVPEIRVFAEGAAVATVAVGDFVVPTETDGELRIYYSTHDPRRYVSAVDVLDGKVDPLRLQRKLVLIGASAQAMADYANTALGERMPGSEIIAQVLENLYDQNWLIRPPWAAPIEIGAFVLLGLALIWATPRWKPAHAALLAVGAIALPIGLGFALFVWRRWMLDAAAPSLGLLVLFSVLLVLTLAEASRQRRRLERVIQGQREQAAYIAGEVEAAKRIQTGFLPSADSLKGERRIDLAATMTPAREVGGDLYDFFLLGDDRLFFMIGDVAGKGLSASMFMAVSKALYKSSALRSPKAIVGDLMRTANEEVSRDNPEMFFVTAFAGVLDLESGMLAYSNAGHDSPYLMNACGSELSRLAGAAGPPLCAVEDFAYDDTQAQLQPGQIVCLVTDGVADAQNPAGERYGSARLRAVLEGLGDGERTARSVLDALSADVQRFAAGAEPADDLTVLVVRWIGPDAGP